MLIVIQTDSRLWNWGTYLFHGDKLLASQTIRRPKTRPPARWKFDGSQANDNGRTPGTIAQRDWREG